MTSPEQPDSESPQPLGAATADSQPPAEAAPQPAISEEAPIAVQPPDEPTPIHADTDRHGSGGYGSDPGYQSSLQSLMSVIVIALFVITFVVQAFEIPSESMENTLLIGDYLLVNKVPFGQGGAWGHPLPYRDIERGDIIVFHYPVDPSQHFVKRVIGIPGDRIHLRDKAVFINGTAVEEPFAIHEWGNHDSYRDNFPSNVDYSGEINRRWRNELPRHTVAGELVVPDGQYFVMGDNRDRSLDSRYWGFVPRNNIVGRPLVIYLSVRQPRTGRLAEPEGVASRAVFTLSHIWQLARWGRMFHLVQ